MKNPIKKCLTSLLLLVFLAVFSVPGFSEEISKKTALPAQSQAGTSRLKRASNSLVDLWGTFAGTLFSYTHLVLRKLDIT